MRHIMRLLLLSTAALLLFTIRLEAQVTTSTLVGLVRDASGAVIPGGNGRRHA